MEQKLNEQDRQRIEQEAKVYRYSEYALKVWIQAATYEHNYQREQQAERLQLPPDNETVEDGGGCYVAGSRGEYQPPREGDDIDTKTYVESLLQQINQLKAENERLIMSLDEYRKQSLKDAKSIDKLETLLHKILKESMGGNVLMTDETYGELKATLNV